MDGLPSSDPLDAVDFDPVSSHELLLSLRLLCYLVCVLGCLCEFPIPDRDLDKTSGTVLVPCEWQYIEPGLRNIRGSAGAGRGIFSLNIVRSSCIDTINGLCLHILCCRFVLGWRTGCEGHRGGKISNPQIALKDKGH